MMVSPARKPRYESLDAWRGAACLAVVAFHALYGFVATPELVERVRTSGGSVADWLVVASTYLWVGVPLFFVISGYCIAAAADSSREKPSGGLTFLWRRLRRIGPPLWIYLTFAALAIGILPDALMPGPVAGVESPMVRPTDVKPAQWLGSITLTEEWRPNFGGPPKGYFAGQLWTLCYEEQFYLATGLIVMFARRWLFPLFAAVTVLVFLNVMDVSAVVGTPFGINPNSYQMRHPGFFFNGLWFAFAAGIAVYYRVNHATPVMRLCVDGVLVLGLVIACKTIPSVWDLTQNLPGYAVVAFAGALLLGWLHKADSRLATARLTSPLRWAGGMCYSIYLVHYPLAIFVQGNLWRLGFTTPLDGLLVTLPVTIAASVALGWAFHRAVERRFRNRPADPK